MNVLFFTYDFPFPTTSGGKSRAYNLIKHAGGDTNIILFSFTREKITEERIREIKNTGIKDVLLFPRRKVSDIKNIAALTRPNSSFFRTLYFDAAVFAAFQKAVREYKIDIIHFESFYTAFYLHTLFREAGIKQVFGTENIEFQLYEDYAKHMAHLFLKPFYAWEAKKIKREELGVYKKADICLAVTEQEAEFINQYATRPAAVIPNGVDTSFFSFQPKKPEPKKNILFIGNFTYFPNIDGIRFFYHEVFIKLENDSIILTIVGKNANQLQFLKNDSRVRLLPFIEDIREAYYDADVFVSPIRIGGGTNFKVLEAMATGVPVVAFPDRIAGIGAKDETHLLEAHNAEAFQKSVIRLLRDEKLREHISRNGRKRIEEKFDWRIIGKKLNEVWKKI